MGFPSECYDCGGADDQCECNVGETASECALNEDTIYDLTLSWSGWYCDQKVSRIERSVVNMCIQGVSGAQGSFTYSYSLAVTTVVQEQMKIGLGILLFIILLTALMW